MTNSTSLSTPHTLPFAQSGERPLDSPLLVPVNRGQGGASPALLLARLPAVAVPADSSPTSPDITQEGPSSRLGLLVGGPESPGVLGEQRPGQGGAGTSRAARLEGRRGKGQHSPSTPAGLTQAQSEG